MQEPIYNSTWYLIREQFYMYNYLGSNWLQSWTRIEVIKLSHSFPKTIFMCPSCSLLKTAGVPYGGSTNRSRIIARKVNAKIVNGAFRSNQGVNSTFARYGTFLIYTDDKQNLNLSSGIQTIIYGHFSQKTAWYERHRKAVMVK